MMAVSRSKVLSLYKQMMTKSKLFTNYNFWEYALRRVQDSCKQGKIETDTAKVELFKYAEENLESLKRQVVIGRLYQENAMVLEAMKN